MSQHLDPPSVMQATAGLSSMQHPCGFTTQLQKVGWLRHHAPSRAPAQVAIVTPGELRKVLLVAATFTMFSILKGLRASIFVLNFARA